MDNIILKQVGLTNTSDIFEINQMVMRRAHREVKVHTGRPMQGWYYPTGSGSSSLAMAVLQNINGLSGLEIHGLLECFQDTASLSSDLSKENILWFFCYVLPRQLRQQYRGGHPINKPALLDSFIWNKSPLALSHGCLLMNMYHELLGG